MSNDRSTYQVCLFLLPAPENGDAPVEFNVYDFKGPGIALAMYNVDEVCISLLL